MITGSSVPEKIKEGRGQFRGRKEILGNATMKISKSDGGRKLFLECGGQVLLIIL